MACQLLPGLLGVVVQGLLFLGVCVALVWKKAFDDPPRSWAVFLADSSKQAVGSGWLHLLNMLSSWGLDAHVGAGDACDWYFVNIVVDCTIGVAVEFALIKAWACAIPWLGRPELTLALESGNYYEPVGYGEESHFQFRRYVMQLSLWVLIVTQMKVFVVLLLLIAQEQLLLATSFLLGSIPDGEQKLVVVMVVVPFAMNTLQVCLVDLLIKYRRASES